MEEKCRLKFWNFEYAFKSLLIALSWDFNLILIHIDILCEKFKQSQVKISNLDKIVLLKDFRKITWQIHGEYFLWYMNISTLLLFIYYFYLLKIILQIIIYSLILFKNDNLWDWKRFIWRKAIRSLKIQDRMKIGPFRFEFDIRTILKRARILVLEWVAIGIHWLDFKYI